MGPDTEEEKLSTPPVTNKKAIHWTERTTNVERERHERHKTAVAAAKANGTTLNFEKWLESEALKYGKLHG